MNAYRRGAYACLLKPLESRKVISALEEAMERAARSYTLAAAPVWVSA